MRRLWLGLAAAACVATLAWGDLRAAVATAREAIPTPPPSDIATIDGITQAYGRGDFSAVTQALRGAKGITALVDAFIEAGNPWPDRPEREAAFVLELAHAAIASPQRNSVAAVRQLLDRHRRLVRDPIDAGPFERYWLWAATAMLQGAYEPATTQWFMDEALKRFPAEPDCCWRVRCCSIGVIPLEPAVTWR